ncbi:MAG TPA: EFR1 family ferrodoxin [Myxococcales bacterium]|jgi:ferredoxin
MTTTLYVYTGTGNSLWAARTLAASLGDAEVVSMAHHPEGPVRPTADTVGLVFPVHMWGIPSRPLDFVRRLELAPTTYLFAVAVNAGQVSRTLVQLREELAARSLRLYAGYSLEMPSNYIPWGGPGPHEEMERRFAAARAKLADVAARAARRDPGPVEQGPLWQRVAFTQLYKLSFGQVRTMDRNFFVDERCNGCGVCERVCPSGNVAMVAGKPRWSGRCEQCLACLQWCPTKALQYGKKTERYERYHHPEVRLADVVAMARAAKG